MKTIFIYLSILFYFEFASAQEKGTFTDPRDGRVYKTVVIGTQVWMAENLQATVYNDGTQIPTETINSVWDKLETPAYCWYKSAESAKTTHDEPVLEIDGVEPIDTTYGALYNWHAVNTGKLAPKGWHIPKATEWKLLHDFVSGKYDYDGGAKLRETGTLHWKSPNIATDVFGFTALPGGERHYGTFINRGDYAAWWSSTEIAGDKDSAADQYITHLDTDFISGETLKVVGHSVRCIKD